MPDKTRSEDRAGTPEVTDRALPERSAPAVEADVEVYSQSHANSWHSHERACLIHPTEGVVIVESGEDRWVVPPHQAVWVSGGVRHRAHMSGKVAMRNLIVDEASLPGLPQGLRLLAITPLLRELILHACEKSPGPSPVAADAPIIAVILDQLRSLPVPALPLPLPRDRRLLRLTEALLANPGDKRSLEDWGRSVGASSRTLARLFRAETAMTFRTWRQHLRILEALRRLAEGEAVTNVALDVGYDSPSAFVQVFKKHLGRTPGSYLS